MTVPTDLCERQHGDLTQSMVTTPVEIIPLFGAHKASLACYGLE